MSTYACYMPMEYRLFLKKKTEWNDSEELFASEVMRQFGYAEGRHRPNDFDAPTLAAYKNWEALGKDAHKLFLVARSAGSEDIEHIVFSNPLPGPLPMGVSALQYYTD